MSRSLPPVRYIKPESIKIGDTIKVEGQYHDAVFTRTGRVAKRDQQRGLTEWLTAQGVIMVTRYDSGHVDGNVKVTLLNRLDDMSVKLEGLES